PMDSRHERARRRRQARRQSRAGPPPTVAWVTPNAPPGYDPGQHNHVRKQLALIASGELQLPGLGELAHVTVAHAIWCSLLTRAGYCDCDPEIRVSPAGDTS